jgi:cytochrome c-type biogenesis protein CcmF
MATLGYYLLLAAFVVSAYAAAMSVAGARRRSTALIESGVGAFYLVAAIMAAASAIIVHAFVVGDYSIKYVQRYSDSIQPLFYKLTSYWGGLDGSIMFWVFMLSLAGSVAVYVNRERQRELIPYVVATIATVQMFFLFLMVVHNNPFSTYITENPTDGNGLSPLLQNFYMVIHPPTMYLGFVGCTIPFAFGMAALITGHLDDSWLRATRRWTMISWLFLTIGLMLGMLWAYEELGWGGYWFWDPVENAAVLPWFTATAFLHSVMVQERRGMLRVWNLSLVILTFFLTIFGTFLTRSGVVQSVHAFGEDPELAAMFTGFMVVLLVFSFGFVIYRLPLLKARHELDSWMSREAAFLANNWILLFSAFFVLFATMFPTLSEAVRGERITVGAPFFNRWMLPIGLALLLLTGVGPLLAWRKSTILNLRDSFLFPVGLGLAVGATVVAFGVRVWSAGLCFAFSGFVIGTILQEFWRGARVRQGGTGTDLFTAVVGLVGRNKRRYGGYVVHVGVVLIFLGFAGSNAFKQEETGELRPGQTMTVGDYTVRFEALKVTDDGQKQMVTAHMTVIRDGNEITKLYPARWSYRKHEDEPTSEVSIYRTVAEDLYIAMPTYNAAEQIAQVRVTVNPLINWLWLGFGVAAIGTVITLLPETAFAFAVTKVPAGAVTTSVLLISLLLPVAARAQHVETGRTPNTAAQTPVEREVGHAVVCMCGTCGRKLVSECTCAKAEEMRSEIAALVKRWSNRGRPRRKSSISTSRSTAVRSRSRNRSTRASIAWPGRSRM